MTKSETIDPSVDNLPKPIPNPLNALRRLFMRRGKTAEKQRLTHVEAKVANEGTPDEFEYFTQSLGDGSYYPGLSDYLKPDFGKDYIFILTKDNMLVWGLAKKHQESALLNHGDLRKAIGINKEDVAIISFLSADTTLGIAVDEESYLDALINYWARSFKTENPHLVIHYPGGGQSNIDIHEYVNQRKTGQTIARTYPEPH